MLLKILTLPDKRLRVKAKTITVFNDKLKELADDMFATMYYNNGIGLAATQVNRHIKMFVADVKQDTKPEVFINPKIINKYDKRECEEGCLSIPKYTVNITRADKIQLQYQNINGEKQLQEFDGLLATCIQHEMDHLQGIVLTDYLSKLKQKRLLTKLSKAL